MKTIEEMNLTAKMKLTGSVSKNRIVSNLMKLGFIKVSSEENVYNTFFDGKEITIFIEIKDSITLNAYYESSYYKQFIPIDYSNSMIIDNIESLIENLFFKHYALIESEKADK